MARSRLEMKMVVLECLSPHEGKKISKLIRETNVPYHIITQFLDFYVTNGLVSKVRGELVGPNNRPLSDKPKVCTWFYYSLTEKGRQLLKLWKAFAIPWMNIWKGSLYD